MEQIKKKNWYAFYTSPRAEKKVNIILKSMGYDTFLPIKKESKIWKNRQRKIIEIPLFPSYIFINTYSCKIFEVNKTHGICNCVSIAKTPVIVNERDIMSLKIMQEMNIETLKNENFDINDKIRVIDGPLSNYEGILIKTKGANKFGIYIPCTNLVAVVDLSASKIEKL